MTPGPFCNAKRQTAVGTLIDTLKLAVLIGEILLSAAWEMGIPLLSCGLQGKST